jgi:hypothetical protein
MGASNSFMIKLVFYLSFPEENEFVIGLKRKLLDLNYSICDTSIVKKSLETLTTAEISKHMETLINNTRFIIICVSLKSLTSFTQSIEMNNLLDNSFDDNKKVIYLIMDENYPCVLINKHMEKNDCFLYYDQETISESFEKINEMLK